VQYPLKTGETPRKGAAVLLDANEEVTECGDDPGTVLGFAASTAAASPLFGRAEPEAGTILVNVAENHRRFWCQGSSDPTVNDVGQMYGIAKDGDGDWYLDKADTTNLVLYVHTVDLDRDLFEVSVIDSVAQIPQVAES
jgi:hypothetical protein